jgi:hypothetical protein
MNPRIYSERVRDGDRYKLEKGEVSETRSSATAAMTIS